VLILAALPDPSGTDRGHEVLTLLNATAAPVDLTGWSVHDRGGSSKLGGTLAAGAVTQVTLSEGVQFGNEGDSLTLIDPSGRPIDRVSYTAAEVKPGRTIAFR
jgi:Lamin Tail Domain